MPKKQHWHIGLTKKANKPKRNYIINSKNKHGIIYFYHITTYKGNKTTDAFTTGKQ